MKTNLIKSILTSIALLMFTTISFSQCFTLSEQYSNYNGSKISCFGANDGSISLTPVNSTGNVSYLWSNGETNCTISNLTAGSYTVIAQDNLGCSVTQTYNLQSPLPISFTTTQTLTPSGHNLKCYGDNNARVTVLATGGSGKIFYSWTNGNSTAFNNNLSAGVYTVTATDENGCLATQTITVTQPTPVEVEVVVVTQPTGIGQVDGTLIANVTGGVGNYTYEWSDGQTDETAIELSAGIYTVVVKDSYNCGQRSSAHLVNPLNNTISLNNNNRVSTSRNSGNIGLNRGITPKVLNNDIKSSTLMVQNIDLFQENQLIITDFMGNVLVNIQNYNNDWSSQIQNLSIGNYVVILNYIEEGEQKTVTNQLVVTR